MDEKLALVVEDWQSNALATLSEFQSANVLCDTLLVLDSGKEIPCHGCVVAATIPYLKSQLLTNTTNLEIESCKTLQKISIAEISDEILQHVVNFSYTGHIEVFRNDITALSVAAKKLNIEELERLCIDVSVSQRQEEGNMEKKIKSESYTGIKTRSRHCKSMYQSKLNVSTTDLNEDKDEKAQNKLSDVQSDATCLAEVAMCVAKDNSEQPNCYITNPLKTEITSLFVSDASSFDGSLDVKEEAGDMSVDDADMSDQDIASNSFLSSNQHEESGSASDPKEEEGSKSGDASDDDTKEVKRRKLNHKWECEVCNRVFVSRVSLKDHMNTHSGIKPYKCSECDKCYSCRQSLKDHFKIHRGMKFNCKVCSKVLLSRKRLNAHLRTHPPDWQPKMKDKGDFECSVCNKQFKSYRSYGDHMNIHKGLKPYKCPHCDKTYSTKLSLKEHSILHRDEMHICDTCGKACTSRKYLRRHIKEHELADLRKGVAPDIPCDKCDKMFYSESDMNKHRNSVHIENCHVCPSCGKTYKTKGTLDSHYAFCTQTGKHECDFCEKNYSTRESLRKHITWAHKDEMLLSDKYKSEVLNCSYCDKIFLSRSLLQTHENLHTRAQTFDCEICGKSFHSVSNLGTHKRNVHLDVPDQFKCQVCGTTTKSQRAFKRHLKLHSTNPEYACEFCGKNYNRRDMLNAHLQSCGGSKLMDQSVESSASVTWVIEEQYY